MIPFFEPSYGEREARYAKEALRGEDFLERAKILLRKTYGESIFLTTSASAAFELLFAALRLEGGGEVVMPSFTFPSCANSVLRAGLKPVFADIEEGTKVLSPAAVESALTENTRAVIPMHYGAASMDLDALKKGLGKVLLIEDAALSFGARYRERPLGRAGDAGLISFHRTKNISADEGGLLLLNDGLKHLEKTVQTLYDNGTNRAEFLRGEVSAYTWQTPGMNVAMGNLNAALLCAQLERADEIVKKHEAAYRFYEKRLAPAAEKHGFTLPVIPTYNDNNFELFYIVLKDEAARVRVQRRLKEKGIGSAFHYMALHASAMGASLGHGPDDLPVTNSVCGRLLRLPLFASITTEQCAAVADAVEEALCGR